MWDPATYLRYGDERGRPFGELIGRIGPLPAPDPDQPFDVVDLGCGPGSLTVGLTERFPGARIRGFDSLTEMITAARTLGSTVEFDVLDVRDWQPDPAVRVVLANAVLQWV